MAGNTREVVGSNGVKAELHGGEVVKPKGAGNLTVKLDLDASDVISGLKALQREARDATKALRELETYYEENGKRFYTKWKQDTDDNCSSISEVCVSDIPTKYLSRELEKREGVSSYDVGPHGEHAIIKFYDESGNVSKVDVDGATIIVNRD